MRPKKVCLCVSSDIQALSILAFVLHTNGFAVRQAATVDEALLIARNGFFDVLLTHHALDPLGGVDGNQLIQQVKELQPVARSILIRAANAGTIESYADAQIDLPWEAAKLLEVVRLLSRRKRGRPELLQ